MFGTKFWIITSLAVAFFAGLTTSILQHQHEVMKKHDVALPSLKTWHYPDTFAKQLQGNPKAGEMVYRAYCASCHNPNPEIPVRAPRINQQKVWLGLRALGEKNLLQSTLQGVGAMPARGGCFECDDKSLKMAVEYMLQEAVGD